MDPKSHKFYVASPNAWKNGWAKADLKAAIEHARSRVESTGEDQYIVKVIKVVRRKRPIVVEDVK